MINTMKWIIKDYYNIALAFLTILWLSASGTIAYVVYFTDFLPLNPTQ